MGFTMLTVRVGQGLRLANGQPARARVRFTPTATEGMRNGVTTLDAPVVVDVGADGVLVDPVAATDDPGTTPAGAAYLIEVTAEGARPRRFYAPLHYDAPDGVVDLDALDELTAPPVLVTPLRLLATAADVDVDAALVGRVLVVTGVNPLTFGFADTGSTPASGVFPSTFTPAF